MTLNETQSGAVCQAFCAMTTLTDAAYDKGLDPTCFITANGFLVFNAGPVTKVLRHVKDRTPKEIEDYVQRVLQAIEEAEAEAAKI